MAQVVENPSEGINARRLAGVICKREQSVLALLQGSHRKRMVVVNGPLAVERQV